MIYKHIERSSLQVHSSLGTFMEMAIAGEEVSQVTLWDLLKINYVKSLVYGGMAWHVRKPRLDQRILQQ